MSVDQEVVGYTVSVVDNGTTMFPAGSPGVPKCPRCGHPKVRFAHDPEYRLNRRPPTAYLGLPKSKEPRELALGLTYDRRLIASDAFRQWCHDMAYPDVAFLPFDRDPTHFQMQVERQVPFDAERRRTRFIDRYTACGAHKQVIGATPAYLEITGELTDGFHLTDLAFGPSPNQSPLLVVSPRTKADIEARFEWIGFNDAFRSVPAAE